MEELIKKSDARRAVLHECPAAAHCIDSIKPVKAVEVVHGKWIEINPRKDVEGWIECDYQCSVCKEVSWEEGNYCPNCGAKMDLEDYNEFS